jgi:FixJ family two-component response regulator
MTEQPTVIIVDDDPGIREALGSLIRSVGVQAKTLASVPEFLNEGRPDGPTWLVLDVRLPGRSGLDFQRELAAANIRVPIIFITGHGDIPMSVQAIKGGAIEFLTKPFRDQDLLDAIQLGLARDRAWLENEKAIAVLRARFETLTPREREVMAGGGWPPQQADRLRHRHQRDHCESPSRPGDAKDEGRFSAGLGPDGR